MHEHMPISSIRVQGMGGAKSRRRLGCLALEIFDKILCCIYKVFFLLFFFFWGVYRIFLTQIKRLVQ